jgi:hypothetical protein
MQRKTFLVSIALRALLLAGCAVAATAAHAGQGFAPQFIVSSTIPDNGDLNPYGVAVVPPNFPTGGTISPGDVLVSNFNNSNNLQGTGVTIIKLTPTGPVAPSVSPGQAGTATKFFTSNLQGLTTALGILQGGFVLVGNLPSTDGTFKTHGQGALQVIDHNGNFVTTFTDPKFLGSPWDLTINDNGARAQVFVSNAVKGTVARIELAVGAGGVSILTENVIADGYGHRGDPAAFVLGPTGLAYDKYANILYVASTLDNKIYAIPAAGTRTSPPPGGTGAVVFSDPHLRGPLALAFTPLGHLVTTNGDAINGDPTHPSGIVEFTKGGQFVSESNIDASQGGAFGIAIQPFPFNFAAVDDVPNTITVFTVPSPFGSASAQIAATPAGR